MELKQEEKGKDLTSSPESGLCIALTMPPMPDWVERLSSNGTYSEKKKWFFRLITLCCVQIVHFHSPLTLCLCVTGCNWWGWQGGHWWAAARIITWNTYWSLIHMKCKKGTLNLPRVPRWGPKCETGAIGKSPEEKQKKNYTYEKYFSKQCSMGEEGYYWKAKHDGVKRMKSVTLVVLAECGRGQNTRWLQFFKVWEVKPRLFQKDLSVYKRTNQWFCLVGKWAVNVNERFWWWWNAKAWRRREKMRLVMNCLEVGCKDAWITWYYSVTVFLWLNIFPFSQLSGWPCHA